MSWACPDAALLGRAVAGQRAGPSCTWGAGRLAFLWRQDRLPHLRAGYADLCRAHDQSPATLPRRQHRPCYR